MPKGDDYFNLLDERWIPILWQNGVPDRLGILETLREAPSIREIAASNPIDRVALLRFFLALTYWCQGNPSEGASRSRQKWFPKRSWDVLTQHKSTFNLFGRGPRFYQSRLENADNSSPNRLIHEIPSGTNANHFRHANDERDGLCPACCALGLLRLPAFATQGGKGFSPGINAKPPVYALPMGDSLATTILLSWQEPEVELGKPAWLDPDLRLPSGKPVPLLTGLTWLPWRVWLDDPAEPRAACIACGRVELLVRGARFKGRGARPKVNWRDPHALEAGQELLQAANPLRARRKAARSWFDVLSGLIERFQQSPAPRWHVVGFATAGMKFVDVTDLVVEVSGNLSADSLAAFAKKLRGWRRSARVESLANQALKSRTARAALAAAIAPELESGFAAAAFSRLSGSQDTLRSSLDQRAILQAVAPAFVPGWTVEAVRGQRRIGCGLLPVPPLNAPLQEVSDR